MKISIITVVFNNDKTIEAAITSVLSQKYKDLEYIIIDGGSTDGTLEILRKYEASIHRIISEPDLGIYDAMNKGLRLATGAVIGILNSDDLYEDENVLQDVMSGFFRDKELDVLYGNLVYVRHEDVNRVVRRWISKEYHEKFFERGNVPPHPCLFLKSEVYQKAGFFDLRYKFAADYEFMLRVFKKHNFKSQYVDRLMVRMRLGGATNSNLKNILKGNMEILSAWVNLQLEPPLLLMPIRIFKRLVQFI